ncbi:MAG TPA: cytochrome P450 [Trebonia sp.]|nr:cytochrome P450 [Trebonia sp.]
MERHCAALVTRLGDSGTFDLPQEMNDLVLGVIMESFLGAEFARHMPPRAADDFRDLMRGLDPVTPSWVPAPHLVRARRARDRLRAAVVAVIESRAGRPADPPDFLQGLLAARALDGSPAQRSWVVQLALGVAFAGHDSTTGHLSWAVVDLLQHPAELARVRAEQRDHLRPGEPLDLATIHRMAVLGAALRETARLHPVAPVMLRRAMRPLEAGGFAIPAGADVFVAPAVSHRLPALFDEPGRYVPGRFLADPGLAAHLHGFGGGAHRCLGEHFAGLLAHIAVTRLLEHFDLTLADRPRVVPTPAFKGVRSPCRLEYRRRAARRGSGGPGPAA